MRPVNCCMFVLQSEFMVFCEYTFWLEWMTKIPTLRGQGHVLILKTEIPAKQINKTVIK